MVGAQNANPTTPNRIDSPGTTAETWESWAGLRHLPAVEPGTWPSVVIVAAHPDDEILGAGGILALLGSAGARLRLVAVTDGEGSHPDADPAQIALLRAMESAAALETLGVQDIEVVRLGFPDTGLTAREDELTARLRELCAGFDVCLAPWEQDAHADHETTGRAARRAASVVFSYPIWMWHWAAPGDARVPWHQACRVPLSPHVAARKRAAVRAFTSQLTDRGATLGPVLPASIVAHFTTDQEMLLR